MNFRKTIIIASATFLFFTACNKEGGAAADASSATGKGGSLARFTIVGNYLYLADWSTLRVFDISNPSSTNEKPSVEVGFGIETLFPYKDKLFIGASTGMFIYSLAQPAAPVKLGSVQHLRSCDPVVANDTISYVTLQGNNPCGPAESGLYIYDIKNISAPKLLKLMPLSYPKGLGLMDSVVFVCRQGDGLTAVNVKKPSDPKIMYTKNDAQYFDVIPYDNLLICYVNTGIVIYDAADLGNILKVGVVNN